MYLTIKKAVFSSHEIGSIKIAKFSIKIRMFIEWKNFTMLIVKII